MDKNASHEQGIVGVTEFAFTRGRFARGSSLPSLTVSLCSLAIVVNKTMLLVDSKGPCAGTGSGSMLVGLSGSNEANKLDLSIPGSLYATKPTTKGLCCVL